MAYSEEKLRHALQDVQQAVASEHLSTAAAENLTHWLKEPPYRRYFDDIAATIDAGDFSTLEDLFWQQIPFGTGGRRGKMSEFGSATMNAGRSPSPRTAWPFTASRPPAPSSPVPSSPVTRGTGRWSSPA